MLSNYIFTKHALMVFTALVILPSQTIAERNYLEQPEGSCTVLNGFKYKLECTLKAFDNLSFDGNLNGTEFQKNNGNSHYYITKEGGLFIENSFFGFQKTCQGITSPFDIEQDDTHHFFGTDRQYYFSSNYEKLMTTEASQGGISIYYFSCTAEEPLN